MCSRSFSVVINVCRYATLYIMWAKNNSAIMQGLLSILSASLDVLLLYHFTYRLLHSSEMLTVKIHVCIMFCRQSEFKAKQRSAAVFIGPPCIKLQYTLSQKYPPLHSCKT